MNYGMVFYLYSDLQYRPHISPSTYYLKSWSTFSILWKGEIYFMRTSVADKRRWSPYACEMHEVVHSNNSNVLLHFTPFFY